CTRSEFHQSRARHWINPNRPLQSRTKRKHRERAVLCRRVSRRVSRRVCRRGCECICRRVCRPRNRKAYAEHRAMNEGTLRTRHVELWPQRTERSCLAPTRLSLQSETQPTTVRTNALRDAASHRTSERSAPCDAAIPKNRAKRGHFSPNPLPQPVRHHSFPRSHFVC
ncbi:MAG: hypothetical protein RL591_2181, partial [Planctomycetota bacterium]